MAGRAPSFVVVGLALITFLVGFFYMSCSSKTSELQRTLDGFEGRIRVLTIKNSDKERELETVFSQKRQLEQEKSDNHKQIEKKNAEINELNTKLNERLAELRSLKSDKQVLDERLKEYKNASDLLASKNFAIGKLQQEYDERKKSDSERVLRLQEEIDRYKNRLNQSKEGLVDFANQRFRPLLPVDERDKNTSSFLQRPFAKLSNITSQIKDGVAPVIADVKQSLSNLTHIGHDSNVNQNLPAPPLDNNRREMGHAEHGRVADIDNQIQDRANGRQRQRRSIDDMNKPLEGDTTRNNSNRSSRVLLNDANVANHLDDAGAYQSANGKNYRVANRDESQKGFLRRNDRDQVIVKNRQKEGLRGGPL